MTKPKHSRLRWLASAAAIMTIALVAVACGSDDDETPATRAPQATATTAAGSTGTTAASPAAASNPLEGVPGIVDPKNTGWPREVEGLNGKVSIKAKPARIHTMSAGLDEMTLGLVPVSRIVGVGSATKNPDSSSMSDLVKNLPTVAREPEAVAGVNPDIVIASPTQKADVIDAIARLEVPVVQLDLKPTPEGRIAALRLLGYIYGEEARAEIIAKEVQERYDAVYNVTSKKADSAKPVVLSATKYTALNISGAGTTLEAIIQAAGGVNAGTKGGLQGNAVSSLEAFVAINPDIIILPMARDAGEAFKAELLANPALAATPAIRNAKVIVVPPQLYTTNSFANVRAVEQLAHLLHPAEFPNAETPQFKLPAGQ